MVGTLEARVLPTARKLNALDAAGLATPPAVEVTPRSVAAPELQPAECNPWNGSGRVRGGSEESAAYAAANRPDARQSGPRRQRAC